ncbi:aminomethyl-transferring glycine dehydrogenase subunit GcvPA [Lujinxingia litoralis]|uniref:Probable glycine dehydrogenase (decarboxylating) subunit 1 n=1 Tax=Lujinxingia litoralis TaxID=2211119 RepID=A0A328C6L0_9DELT|nr:aminomethyl-transferring glycine dehydrogenase subunit GcvPA [Lujinxingia litoralis]RAL23575.1 aminomethyl-transferring glycine dehydrogenase subunit GcvPA [Lujinxingia litoralis]
MRYIPHTAEDIARMLQAIGVESIDELFESIPAELREKASQLELPPPMSEIALDRHLGGLASRNQAADPSTVSLLGAGCYDHVVPQAISQLLLRAEFLTSYTPYQPEISQGTTKTIFEFQSMVSEVLEMPIANASMYDGAHATAEAALMAQRVSRRDQVWVSKSVHPEYREVIETYLRYQDGVYREFEVDATTGQLDLDDLKARIEDPKKVACVIFQTPNFFGVLEDPRELVAWAQEHKILTVAAFNEPHAFALAMPPGSAGVDICAGEGMGLGVGLSYGGPALGIFAAREKHLRAMPGRLSGQTVDAMGREGYVLTLSTREQHIRRAKATSNICTNQGLMALAAAIYLSLMGREGFKELAQLNMARARYALEAFEERGLGTRVYTGPFFNEVVVELAAPAREVIDACLEQGIIPGFDLGSVNPAWSHRMLVACTEMTTAESLDRALDAVAAAL